ncbi:hypothetical protein Tsubulata_000566 [Turnera subulata]|uniref:PHD-type domain-containing protein n=1 Tax=Turnera subulata TaxID=218843 RepID=A0A9Q0J9R7_9ROSI|nr:hypothetical protein Tsubulata_000566 [Turnera subulata]
MAFHVACPITCRRICYCSLGFPRDLHSAKSKAHFLLDVSRIEAFLSDPSGIRASRDATVQVSVPKVAPAPSPPPPLPAPPPAPLPARDGLADVAAPAVEASPAVSSPLPKRVAFQKQTATAAAKIAAEFQARKLEAESADVADATKDATGEELVSSNGKITCLLCFSGESEGSEKARRMPSCKSCGRKYHTSCLKIWAQHRDLFHWSSWTCPFCRICEVCRRTGEPNKFMFCKRCDGAYHCYCQHPPHKNVSSGPYVCPKHTRCHSCGSNVPGNGLSVRWFLGYTCCDACGRLFVKGNYCPVCLKVYRDSEATPMVCCDICQRWVHCQCDGISDEKYLQFQVDGNLQYKCATCRGECYQVKDLEDAVQELWRRKDETDRGLIASLRAVAGLPIEDDIFFISPYSDDEENGPAAGRSELGRSLKLSLKGVTDKSPKKSKDFGINYSMKKNAKKKGPQASYISKTEPHGWDFRLYGNDVDDEKDENGAYHREGSPDRYSPVAGIVNQSQGMYSINHSGALKHKFVDEVMVTDGERTSKVFKIKSNKPCDLDSGDSHEKHASKGKSSKTKKLVINLGPRKIKVTSSPRSDGSSCLKEQEVVTSNGNEDAGQYRTNDRLIADGNNGIAIIDADYLVGIIVEISIGALNVAQFAGDTAVHSGQIMKFARREGNLIKLGKMKSEASKLNPKLDRSGGSDGYETIPPDRMYNSSGRITMEESRAGVLPPAEVSILRSEQVSLGKQSEVRPDSRAESNDDSGDLPLSHSLPKESKFSLKLKIKKPNLENQNSSLPEEEKSSIRGQRSKRKRPTFMEKSSIDEDEGLQSNQDSEMMEASWILKKLGKDAIGKRVEVHQSSDNTWHKGVVSDIIEGTSLLSVTLDGGKVKTLELGKQAVRFVPQKQKRSKT